MNGLNVKERRLIVNEGREGPEHDPYGWSERTVILNGNRYTYRQSALGYERLIVNGRKVSEDQYSEFVWLWLTRFDSVEQFDRAYRRAHEPCYDYEPDPYYGHA